MKSKFGLGFLIGVSITFVIGIGAFIVYDKVLSDGNNNIIVEDANQQENENIEKDESDNKVTILSTSDSLVQELYNSIMPEDYSFSSNLFYHDNSYLLASEIDIETRLELTASKWLEKNSDNPSGDVVVNNYGDEYIVPESQIKEIYKKLFGDIEYEIVDTSTACPGIRRVSTDTIGIGTACGGTGMLNIIQNVFQAEKSSDELYIYEKAAFTKYLEKENEQGASLYNLYKDQIKSVLVAENFSIDYSVSSNDIDLSSVLDKLDIYKYTFKSNGDGTYYFYSVERQ